MCSVTSTFHRFSSDGFSVFVNFQVFKKAFTRKIIETQISCLVINVEDYSKDMEHSKYRLKWKKQLEHLQSALVDYLDRQIFCDVSLATEEDVFDAHRFMLSACSPYFKSILNKLPSGNKHPVIFLMDISSLEVKILFDHIYKGKAVVSSSLMPKFLKTCERLQIQGLCSKNTSTNSDAPSVKKTNRIFDLNVSNEETGLQILEQIKHFQLGDNGIDTVHSPPQQHKTTVQLQNHSFTSPVKQTKLSIEVPPDMEHPKYSLKWKKQLEHLQSALVDYSDRQIFCDVSLATEEDVFDAHRLVLSACSPYFESILNKLPSRNKHPVIFLKDISSSEVKILFDYIYKGKTVVSSGLMPKFLKTCERLQIQGLCSKNTNTNNENNPFLTKNTKSLVNTLALTSSNNDAPSVKKTNRILDSNILNEDTGLQILKQNKQFQLDEHGINTLHSPPQQNETTVQEANEAIQMSTEYLSFNKTMVSYVDMPKITSKKTIEEIKNASSMDALNQSNILVSPIQSQNSFVFDNNIFNNRSRATSTSSSIIIIQDVQDDVIELSNDKSYINDEKKERHLGLSQKNMDPQTNALNSINISEGLIELLNENSQNHIFSDSSAANPSLILASKKYQESQSDESEIIIKRKNKKRNRIDSNEDLSKAATLPTTLQEQSMVDIGINNNKEIIHLSNPKDLKAKALNRTKRMKFIINKNML